jgi:hypothetical protein
MSISHNNKTVEKMRDDKSSFAWSAAGIKISKINFLTEF